MAPNSSKCGSPIDFTDKAPPPCSVTDDISIGDRLVSVSLFLPIYAVMYLIASFFFPKLVRIYFIIILPTVSIMIGLTLGIVAQKKFKPLKYPTWPKACIILNAVWMVFLIIVSLFHFL
jgi:hypothetical protein